MEYDSGGIRARYSQWSGAELRITSGLREVFCVAKNLGERSATSEPFKPCYTMRGRSPRVQRHEDFRRKSEAFAEVRRKLYNIINN